jgi:hypothetical protein
MFSERIRSTRFVEPRALDIDQFQPGHEARKRQRINGKLGDRFLGRVRLVVEGVHRAVAHLQEIDVPGNDTWAASVDRKHDAVFLFKPLDCDRHAIIGEHALQCLAAQLVVADLGMFKAAVAVAVHTPDSQLPSVVSRIVC